MSKTPIIKLNTNLLNRLYERVSKIPDDVFRKNEEKEMPYPFEEIVFKYEDGLTGEYKLVTKEDAPIRIETDIDTERGIHHAEAVMNYHEKTSSEDEKDTTPHFTITHHEKGWSTPVVDNSGKYDYLFLRIINDWLTILEAIEHPEEIFDINQATKKHRIKPRKVYEKGGDDEEFYTSILKAYQSHRGTAKATGLGTPHSHEYGVRGFWRHYKSGNEVWIKPHQRCVGRGMENQHEYLVVKD